VVVLITGVSLFLLAFILHVLVWRIAVPHRQGTSLVLLLLTVGIFGFLTIYVFRPPILGLSPLRLLLALFLFSSLGTTYIILFSAIEADSPTLTIIELIERNARDGIGQDEIVRVISAHSFLRRRLDQMLFDGMVVKIGDRLFPSAQGRFLTSLILAYRKLLRRSSIAG
jgi:hypothetical protein